MAKKPPAKAKAAPAKKALGVIDWQGALLRATVFYAEAHSIKHGTWKETMGTDPLDILHRPLEQATIETGDYLGGVLIITTTPKRSDLILKAKEDDPRLQPHIGPYKDLSKDFDELVFKWLATQPSVNRIAKGMSLLFQVNDRAEGYGYLKKLIPFFGVPEASEASEFRLSLNRPFKSDLVGAPVNRLTTWQCLQATAFTITGGPQGITTMPDADITNIVIEIDVNTPAVKTLPLFDPKTATKIYSELSKLSDEIAYEGQV